MKELLRQPGGWFYHPHEMSLCGFSGSGKTTLAQKLLGLWAGRGLKVGFLKHDAHRFQMDKEGKDTWLAAKAGADPVAIRGREAWAVLGGGEVSQGLLAQASEDCHALLVEGNKASPLPKLFLLDERAEAEDLLAAGDPEGLLALVGPEEKRGRAAELSSRPYFDRDDAGGIASFVEAFWRSRRPRLKGLVLAGGKSSRMGRDKAALERGGMSQALRTARLLAPFCDEVRISSRPGAELPADAAGFGRLDDRFLGFGPLGGILSAFEEEASSAWIVLACDLPLLVEEDLRALVEARDPLVPATAFEGGGDQAGHPEPLCAIYEPAFRARALAGLARGILCPRRILEGGPWCHVPPPRPEAALNANSPEDWAEAMRRLDERPSEPPDHADETGGAGRRGPWPRTDGSTEPDGRTRSENLDVKDFDRLLAAFRVRPGSERVDLNRAPGRVLARELVADLDQPPFHRSAMDGLALRSADLDPAHPDLLFSVLGVVAAGEARDAEALVRGATRSVPPLPPPGCRLGDGSLAAFEIMTGAALPEGFDTVVRSEDLLPWEEPEGVAGKSPRDGTDRPKFRLVGTAPPAVFSNVHRRGSDYRAGDRLLPEGRILGAADVALLSSAACSRPLVESRPALALITTGSELVPPWRLPGRGQIRSSNLESLVSLCARWDWQPFLARRVPDEAAPLGETVDEALGAGGEGTRLLVLSGGVGKGRYDSVPELLAARGFRILAHGLRQKPGKPLLFGVREDPGGRTLAFGLPGNPVSSLVCFRRYVLPLALGEAARPLRVSLAQGTFLKAPDPGGRTLFFPSLLRLDGEGRLAAEVVEGNGSGDFSQLAGSSGFAELEPGRDTAHGVLFWPWTAPGFVTDS